MPSSTDSTRYPPLAAITPDQFTRSIGLPPVDLPAGPSDQPGLDHPAELTVLFAPLPTPGRTSWLQYLRRATAYLRQLRSSRPRAEVLVERAVNGRQSDVIFAGALLVGVLFLTALILVNNRSHGYDPPACWAVHYVTDSELSLQDVVRGQLAPAIDPRTHAHQLEALSPAQQGKWIAAIQARNHRYSFGLVPHAPMYVPVDCARAGAMNDRQVRQLQADPHS